MPFKCPDKRRAYHREYNKRWYEKNKAVHKDRTRKNNALYKQKWAEFKASQACSHCGVINPDVMDFHHTKKLPDNQRVNRLVSNRQYTAAIKEAKTRCIPLCSNCHRIHHAKERRDGAAKHANKKKKL